MTRRPGSRVRDGHAHEGASVPVPRRLAMWGGFVAVSTFLTAAVSLTAEGHGAGTVRLSKVAAGPYLLSAWTQPNPPRVGRLDVSVAVMQPKTEKPVFGAAVHLSAESTARSGTPLVASLERRADGNPFYYHGIPELPAAGPWRITVAVQGPAGAGQAVFDLDVSPPRPLAWSLAPGAVVAGGLLWWLLARTRSRG